MLPSAKRIDRHLGFNFKKSLFYGVPNFYNLRHNDVYTSCSQVVFAARCYAYKRGIYTVVRCLLKRCGACCCCRVVVAWCLVRLFPQENYSLSGCLSCSYILSKRVNTSPIFSPSGSHTILVFPVPNVLAVFRQGPPNGGVEYRWGRQKSRFSTIACRQHFDGGV